MYQTFTPNAFIQRWGWQAAPAITPQFLRDVFEFIQNEELGGYRWYESPFFAVSYWREASQWPEPPPGLLTQLIELLRRAFVAVDRSGQILNYYNIAGEKVDDVDIPTAAPGPPGRRGSLWFVGHGVPDPSLTPLALNQDIYMNLDNGDVYQFSGGAFRLVT